MAAAWSFLVAALPAPAPPPGEEEAAEGRARRRQSRGEAAEAEGSPSALSSSSWWGWVGGTKAAPDARDAAVARGGGGWSAAVGGVCTPAKARRCKLKPAEHCVESALVS